MKVCITKKIPEKGIQMLRDRGFEVAIHPDHRPLKGAEWISFVSDCDALIMLLTDHLSSGVIKKFGSKMKIIANYAVGYDNIDVKAAQKRNIIVTNTPDVLTTAVGEHTFALMLALAKRIVEADDYMRNGKYKGWEPELLLGTELVGKTLGIVGLGRIGRLVAERSVRGMGMKVVYTDTLDDKAFESKYEAKKISLEELLAISDFVSLHVPLIESTVHLINAEKLAIMKKTAFLINTSRGPVVDEKDLYDALENKTIAGAALDVFECEPKLACDARLRKKAKNLKNLIVTPHTASATFETRDAMSELAAKNVIEVLEGRKPLTPVF